MLDVIGSGPRVDRERFTNLAISRFNAATDLQAASLYIGAVFAIEPGAATNALFGKLDGMTTDTQTTLVQRVLPQIFGDLFSRGEADLANLPFESLERLVRLAFRTIRTEDDRERPNGVVFSPDERDGAERARGAAFRQLVETPGRATFESLLRFAATSDFPVPPARLRQLARDRAAEDSESAPWPPQEPMPFEQNSQTAPSTVIDLQRVVLLRLSDMQHELLHADFRQGTTLSGLPDEAAVQRWIADRLELKQGRSYSVERESHVADEKEPDIRVRAKASDARVPIEVKVAESWTVEQLEAALTEQLCGRYLRSKDAHHGILLLVHQVPRSRGWEHPETGTFLTFEEVVVHLRALAAQVSGATIDAPQPEIAVLDVSSCACRVHRPGVARPKRTRQADISGRRKPRAKRRV